MVDQIIDKRTIAIPGPIGPDGPQGIPGVNAVENDQAVAAYIGNNTTNVHAALENWRPPVNIVEYGADPTGVEDASAIINSLTSQGRSIVIPPGRFLITSPIQARWMSITGVSGNTVIIAGAPMQYMVDLGDLKYDGKKSFSGITLNCNNLAESGTVNGKQAWLNDVVVMDPLQVGIDGSNAQGMRLDGIYVVKDVSHTKTDVIGTILSNDSVCGTITCFGCETGIQFTGLNNQISALYVWCGSNENKTTGINALPTAGINNIGNVYVDTQNVGIKSAGSGFAFNALTVYNMSADSNTYDYQLFDTTEYCAITVNNMDLDGTIAANRVIKPSKYPNVRCSNVYARGPFSGSYYDNFSFRRGIIEFSPYTNFTANNWYKFGHVICRHTWVGFTLLLTMPRLEKAARIYFDFWQPNIRVEKYIGVNANGLSVAFANTSDLEFDLYISSDANSGFELSFNPELVNSGIVGITIFKQYSQSNLPSGSFSKSLTLS